MPKRFLTAAMLALAEAIMGPAAAQNTKPTIVLVHGAFAESSSWNGVVAELIADGYPVVAAANPLRGLRRDADYVAETVRSVKGPVAGRPFITADR
jgi:pimeloyl-ACP methyl ester carboxylesterase